MNRNFLLLLTFLSIIISSPSNGQEDQNEQSLLSVLIYLQDRHSIQFNYASETIEDINISPPSKDWDLEESIDFLSRSTGLRFNRIGNNILTIMKPTAAICGFVKDKDNGDALVFATVLYGSESTVTNEDGYFELSEVSPGSLIEISHIGYKTLQRDVTFFKSEKCSEIYLEPDQQQLAEVVLYDYLTRGIDKLDNGSFSIDFNQFQILPGLIENDVLQSVQAFPGIQSINETVSNINIRGGSHDQNLILWDGIKMYQSGHFFGLISMYNPQITQRVSLQKNGTPATFTDGVSGTIAMETEKAVNADFNGNLSINFLDASGFTDIPLGKKSSIQLAARKSISDLWQTPTYTEYFDRISQDTEVSENMDEVVNSDIKFDFYDTSVRWLYSPTDKDEIQLNFITANNELVFDENAVIDNDQETRQSNLEQNSIAAGLQYRRNWSDKFNTSFELYNTDYKLKAINANIPDDQRFLQENKVSETGLRLTANYRSSRNMNWLNGYQFIETKVSNLDDVDDPVFRRLVAEVLRIHAVFSAVDLKTANRRTSLNAGLRLNYLEKFEKFIWEPRLSLNHKLAEGLYVELLGEYKHQNTSQIVNFQNDFLGIEKRRWQLSNDDDIPILESKQMSAGLSYTNKGWLFSAVGYLKEVEGITTQSQGFQNQYEFVKTDGSYDAFGIDLLFRKQIKNLNTWFSYSYLSNDYFFEALAEETFPSNFDITHAFTAGLTYAPGPIRISGGFNWRSGKPFTTPEPAQTLGENVINYLEANNDRLDDYLRVDVSGLYEFPIGLRVKGQLGVSVWNIFNRENPINTYFRVNAQNEIEQITETSLGITPNAVFRIYF